MTSDDISSIIGAWQERDGSPAREGATRNPGGAWWRVRSRMTTIFLGQVDRWMWRPSWWRVYQEEDLKVMNLRRRVGIFQRRLRRVEARGKDLGDRISGFWSREAKEHVCGVCFDRRRLDVYRSEKLSHGFA